MRAHDNTSHTEPHRAITRALGALLHDARRAKGLSLEAVAHEAGISVPTLSALERGFTRDGGVCNPTLGTVVRVLTTLEVSTDSFMSAARAHARPNTD